MGCYLDLLTEFTEVCMRCYWVLVWSLTRVYWPTFQMFVGGVTGCYWVLLWGLTRGYWPTFQMVCMGCYLTLLTDLTGVCMGSYQGLLTDFTGVCMDYYLDYWPTLQMFVWGVTWAYWPTSQGFVWTVTGCLYGVLPGSIDRPFKCLYGLLLGVTTRSYQSVLTDLSDVCRRCYWVLLWGLTRGYWPTFQRFVCTLIWACWLSYWSVIGRLTRVLYGPLPRVLLRVCVHGEWVLSSLFWPLFCRFWQTPEADCFNLDWSASVQIAMSALRLTSVQFAMPASLRLTDCDFMLTLSL